MPKRRKHRVVVEVTLEKPDTEKRAVYLVGRAMDVGHYNSDHVRTEVTTWSCKSWSRVFNYARGLMGPCRFKVNADYWR